MRLAFAALAALALAPEALAADDAAPRTKTSCLWASQIDGFQDVTRDSVILTIGSRRWRAELAGPCSGLNFAETVAAVATTSCLSEGDKIIYHDAGMERTCFITSLTFVPPEPKDVQQKAQAPAAP